ncbi:MAG: efflux RND transporter permease subunit [Candidatus Ancaeobacter aquaticus]|nr:efflux RND transporter permease subunit [Candidatus Ancaeobacter aquaticus]
MNLPQFSIKRPVSMLMVFTGIILFGIVSYTRLPVELMPNMSYKTISVIIQARGGIPPTEVESLITVLVEEALSTVANLESLSSTSEKGKSTVALKFQPGTDMNFAALEAREKFSKIKNKLPKDIEKPVIAKYEENDVPIMILAITSTNKSYTVEEIRKIVEIEIKERISRVPGVANVDLAGGREEKIIVDVDEERLKAYKLPMNEVVNKIGIENVSLLAGSVKDTRMETKIRTAGLFSDIKEVEQVSIKSTKSGSLIRLKDIAKVKRDYMEPQGYSRINTKGTVSLYVQRESAANTVSVGAGVNKVLENLKPTLPRHIRILTVSNQADFILLAIGEVKKALVYGFVLATIIILLFLRNIFSALIIVMAIPISMMVTFALMYFTGITLNVMTLSGLALGIGMMLDNSIVVLENIFKLKEKGGEPVKAAIDGSNEVLMSIFAATITTIIVFLPLNFVSEQIKILYGGLAITVTYALIASLFTALTMVPLLGSKMKELKKSTSGTAQKKGLHKIFFKYYRKILVLVIRYRYIAIISAFALFIVSLYGSQSLKKELSGGSEQSRFTIFVELPDGARLEMSDIVVKEVEKEVSKNPDVKSVQSRVEGWSSKVYVNLKPEKERQKQMADIVEGLRPKLSKLGKAQDAFIYFSAGQESGGKEILIDIYGHSYDTLKKLAIKISKEAGNIKGLVDTKIRITEGRPEYRFYVDKDAAALAGLTTRDIAEEIHAKIRGLRATAFRTEGREIEIIVRDDEKYRKNKKDIQRFAVFNKNKNMFYVDQVTRYEPGLGPSEIWRNNKSRMIQVSATVTNMTIGTAMEKVSEKLKDFEFPKDFYWEFGGNYAKMQENQKQLFVVFLLSVLLIYMILASLFESYIQPFIILTAVPLALIGAIAGLLMTQKPVTMGVLVGAIMLAGIVASNAIILISKINQLMASGCNLYKALISAGESRLRPIIMTAASTVIALFPMAVGRGGSSALWAPLAITVMGGLITSTFLTLLIIPGIYSMIEDIKKIKARPDEELS